MNPTMPVITVSQSPNSFLCLDEFQRLVYNIETPSTINPKEMVTLFYTGIDVKVMPKGYQFKPATVHVANKLMVTLHDPTKLSKMDVLNLSDLPFTFYGGTVLCKLSLERVINFSINMV